MVNKCWEACGLVIDGGEITQQVGARYQLLWVGVEAVVRESVQMLLCW